jgi:hypothetical protein
VVVHEDGSGHKTAYVVGITESGDFPTVDAVQANLNGASDLLVVSFAGLENVALHTVFLPVAIR